MHKFAQMLTCRSHVDVLKPTWAFCLVGAWVRYTQCVFIQAIIGLCACSMHSEHAVRCCLMVTSKCWSAVDCSISTRVVHNCLSLLWHVGQEDSESKTELKKHMTVVACNP